MTHLSIIVSKNYLNIKLNISTIPNHINREIIPNSIAVAILGFLLKYNAYNIMVKILNIAPNMNHKAKSAIDLSSTGSDKRPHPRQKVSPWVWSCPQYLQRILSQHAHQDSVKDKDEKSYHCKTNKSN